METVFITKNNQSARDLGFEIMEMMGLAQSDWAGKKVLIKPNLTIKAPVDSGIITNPDFCEGIINYLKKNSAKKISIGEGTSEAVNDDMEDVYNATGFSELAMKSGIELINFNKDEMIEGVNLPKSILDFDILINVPVLKTHHIALVTLGIKNLIGLYLPVKERHRAFHGELENLRENAKNEGREALNKEEFKQAHREISEKILDLYKAVSPKIKIITVIDGFYGRDGDGFCRGETKNMGIAIAGENTVAVDTVAADIMGFEKKDIYYLNSAQLKIKIKGINPKSIRANFNALRA
jgi:uncharacterized protein (DUF362 family)